ncbi:MAG: DUF3040 domain-containing protein [Actinomycetota bacterium]|nr:DUF3040 domain-containing protein [Actinomycetota bacterium]
MPLSEHEQRLLDQIERALYAEDPKFASNVRGARLRSPSRRRRLQGIAMFMLGLVLLIVGAAVMKLWVGDFPIVSVLGFLVMFTGAVTAIFARGGSRDAAAGERSGQSPPAGSKSKLAQRMEERFRRRFEER